LCGIAGILDPARRLGIDGLRSVVEDMSARLAHRGPDDRGSWVSPDGLCGLSHRRLTVIDTSAAGRQPMSDRAGACVISYNGEIYNFRELRTELAASGARFTTQSDTEVLVEAFARFGRDVYAKLEGMFAFAAFDTRTRMLTLARDPFGQKPLYVTTQAGAVAFASELTALRAVPWFDPHVSTEAVGDYLAWQYIPDPYSIYVDTGKIDPGSWVEIDEHGQVRRGRHFEFDPRDGVGVAPVHDRVAELDEVVSRAVKECLVSDVPLGALLSSGVDSSLVTAISQTAIASPLRTFSIGFEGAPESEHVGAAETAALLGCDHTTKILQRGVLDVLPKVVAAMDEPNGDPSCLPTFLLAAEARRNVTVVVSGDGGDELFGGYETYLSLAREDASSNASSQPRSIGERYVRQMAAFSPEEIELLLGEVPSRTSAGLASLAAAVDTPDRSLISRLRSVDARTYLPGSVLAKVDRMSMASALEVRSPLLSRRVAAVAAGLKPEDCIEGTKGKALLRTVAARYLPAEWMQRPKRGFGFPSGWLTPESLLPAATRALSTGQPAICTWIEPQRLAQFMRRQQQRHTFEPLKIWRLLLLETWLQTHGRFQSERRQGSAAVPRLHVGPGLVLHRVWPDATEAGVGFNIQPDGTAALAVACEHAGPWTSICFDGHELATAYGNSESLTALVPAEFFATAGSHTIHLEDAERRSNTLPFDVRGSVEAPTLTPDAMRLETAAGGSPGDGRPLRIAFVLPRFMTEYEGGIATYVDRMTQVLLRMGHRPEVFCLSGNEPREVDYYGVPVHRVTPVNPDDDSWLQHAKRFHRLVDLTELVSEVGGARRLAQAVADEERTSPFDLVHCSDVGLTTLFMKNGRPLITRCSWSRDLYRAVDEAPWTPGGWLVRILERMSIRRADVAYAPSRFLADYMARTYGIRLDVLRPPFVMERPPAGELPAGLPPRYLMFLGFLGRRKGTDVIAEALPRVWREEPDFSMVWAGSEYPKPVFDRYRRLWGSRADHVTWLGEISKPLLYQLLHRAEAAVLPSLCDNLPNAAIESLAFGIPVIGTIGTSLDELVEPGSSGHLVPPNDPESLAEAMLRVWRGDRGWSHPPAILRELNPDVAANGLLRLAGYPAASHVRDGTVPQNPIRLQRLHPSGTVARRGFNVQPGGASALSIECEGAGFWTTVVINGIPLQTTYGGPSWLTALVPEHLLQTPGQLAVRLADERLGESNSLSFAVDPA
jgi:asparagine synthase (glutamine-hydrolysing)